MTNLASATGPRLVRGQALVLFVSSGIRRLRSRLARVEPRWLVALSILLLVAGACLVGSVAQRSQVQLLAASGHVSHAMEVEKRARTLVSEVIGGEAAVRTYVVSGLREDVQPYGTALDALPAELQRLRQLTRENRAQQANLGQLDALTNECLDLLGRTIAVHDAGDRETAFALLLAGYVPRLLDAIRSSSSLLVLEEQRALALRQQKLASDAAFGRAWLVFVALVTAIFVVTVLALALQLHKLRRLARLCAWSRKVEYQGEWLSFEDYLRQRFNIETTHGISPAEAAKMRAEMPPA